MQDQKSIPGFEKYTITENGIVINTKTGKSLKTYINKGYVQLMFYINNKQKSVRLHRLIALAFIPNPENKKQINHKNGIKTDNRIDNLEWCTHAENKFHAKINGLVARGEKHNKAKLLLTDIPVIKQRLLSGETCVKIGLSYGVSKSAISRIGLNKLWVY